MKLTILRRSTLENSKVIQENQNKQLDVTILKFTEKLMYLKDSLVTKATLYTIKIMN
jgi:hypothetical protein